MVEPHSEPSSRIIRSVYTEERQVIDGHSKSALEVGLSPGGSSREGETSRDHDHNELRKAVNKVTCELREI